MATDPRAFKETMSRFATGVTVIASGWGDELHAMTATSVASLSLDPLMLLVCLERSSRCAAALRREGTFSVNVLRADQQSLATYFAGAWARPTPPRFEFVPWTTAPRLKGVVAALAATVDAFVEGGDHFIVTGKVTDVYRGPGNKPLIAHERRYRSIGD